MPNEPYLDPSVHWKVRQGGIDFRERDYRGTVDAILDSGLATEVEARVGSGKEADVYLCRDGSHRIAIKSYRFYRTSHRGGRPIKSATMGTRAAEELELLTWAFRGGARVPRPGRRIESMFSMQYLGDSEGPAPRLQQLRPEDPEEFKGLVVAAVRALAESGVVHQDLSPYNVLVFEGLPWIIDLGAAVRVDRLGASPWVRLTEARRALTHGFEAFDRYFRRFGARIDVEEEVGSLMDSLDRFGVLR